MDVSGLRCFFTKNNTGCLLVAYILLLFQWIVGAQAFYLWFTTDSVLKILEVQDTIESWWNFVPLIVSIGLVLTESYVIISCMVTLLVDLHKDDTRLTKTHSTFSSIMLTVTIIFYIVSKYTFDMNPIMAIHRILLLVHAFIPYRMSNSWVTLTDNSLLYEEA